jgi:hypothetical protein
VSVEAKNVDVAVHVEIVVIPVGGETDETRNTTSR